MAKKRHIQLMSITGGRLSHYRIHLNEVDDEIEMETVDTKDDDDTQEKEEIEVATKDTVKLSKSINSGTTNPYASQTSIQRYL